MPIVPSQLPEGPKPASVAEIKRQVRRAQRKDKPSEMAAHANITVMRSPAPGELSVTNDEVLYAFNRMKDADRLYVDSESSGLDRRAPIAIGISLSDGAEDNWASYLPWGHADFGREEVQADREVVTRAWQDLVKHTDASRWRMFNKPFDRGILGATLGAAPDWDDNSYDVLHEAFLCNENGSHRLKDLAVLHLSPDANEEQAALKPYLDDLKNSGHMKVPPSVEAPYAAEDARLTAGLDRIFAKQIAEEDLTGVLKLETQLMPVINAIEDRGMLVDTRYMANKEADTRAELDELRRKFAKMADWDGSTSSPDQLKELLYSKWKLPVGRLTLTGEPSTDKWAIQRLRFENPQYAEVLGVLEELAQIDTILSMFFVPIQEHADSEGVVRGRINQLVRTGRVSMSKPNLQQLPAKRKDVRQGFIVRPGKIWLLVDYSQIELRVLAHYSNDPKMKEAYSAGRDIHQETADLMGVDRKIAKQLNFATVYGAGIAQLARTASITELQAKQLRGAYQRTYPGVKVFSKLAQNRAEDRGWVKTISGRRRRFDEKFYRAGNAILQGSAADIIKSAMVEIYATLNEKYGADHAAMIAMIHDELIIDVDQGIEREVFKDVQRIMTSQFTPPLTVQLEVGCATTTTNWAAEEDVNW